MLPDQFTDRRQDRPGAPDFTDSVCWHLLLGDLEPVQAIAAEAHQRLVGFTGLHITPLRWLHATADYRFLRPYTPTRISTISAGTARVITKAPGPL